MPQSFKGLKSNFSPCNPGAFQTSHAVYWHMTKKVQPPSHLRAYKTVTHLRALVVILSRAPLNKQSLSDGRGPCLSPLAKFVIRCDAVVHFFKFVIKANVFWQQLVTSAPEERQQISFSHTAYQLLIMLPSSSSSSSSSSLPPPRYPSK